MRQGGLEKRAPGDFRNYEERGDEYFCKDCGSRIKENKVPHHIYIDQFLIPGTIALEYFGEPFCPKCEYIPTQGEPVTVPLEGFPFKGKPH